jgi:hypothetical protein
VKNKGKQAYRFIEKTLNKGPSLKASPNAVYTEDDVWDVVLFAATTHRTIEAAVTVLRDRNKEVPSPDIVHRRLREASTGKLVEDFTPCLEEPFTEAKRRRLLQTPKRVAIDIHEKPFYGKAEGTVRGRAKQGTTTFWAYISLDILQEGCRFTLAALPLTDKKKAAHHVEELLGYALRWIRVSVVLLDRFFYRADVIKAVESLGLDWLMAAKTSDGMRGMAEEARDRGEPCFRYTMNPGKANEACFFVFTVPSEKGGYHYFASSREARYLRRWADLYRLRWGVETGYRVKKGFLTRTAVRCMYVRLLLFLVSVLLQNVWELLGRGARGVTADLFRDRLVRVLLSRLPVEGSLPGAPWL